MKKDMSPDMLEVKLGDGTPDRVQARLTFTMAESGVQVNGIIFDGIAG